MRRITRNSAVAVVTVLAIGCQAPVPHDAPSKATPQEAAPLPATAASVGPPGTPATTPTVAELALSDAIGLYEAGDFKGAIQKLLGTKEIWALSPLADPNRTRLTAQKILAFSYCVTNRRPQCRQQFVEAIRLDPSFDLEPTEKTHPIWGPEFDRAKKQAAAPATPTRPSKTGPAGPKTPAKPN